MKEKIDQVPEIIVKKSILDKGFTYIDHVPHEIWAIDFGIPENRREEWIGRRKQIEEVYGLESRNTRLTIEEFNEQMSEILGFDKKEEQRVDLGEEVKDFFESPEEEALVKIFQGYRKITTF